MTCSAAEVLAYFRAEQQRLDAEEQASEKEQREYMKAWKLGSNLRDYHKYFFHTDYVASRAKRASQLRQIEHAIRYLRQEW